MSNKTNYKVVVGVSCLYWLLAALYMYWPSWLDPAFRPYEKALPILLLACWLGWKSKGWALLPVAALVFSAAGDISGDSGASGFLPSIALFGVAQILYAVTFGRSFSFRMSQVPLAVLFIIGIGIMIFHLSDSPKLIDPVLKIVVFAYLAVISAMALTAIFGNKYSIMLPIGALIFVVSDSCIAWDRFISPVPNAGFWVMFTYGLAQYLITLGLLYSKSKEQNKCLS